MIEDVDGVMVAAPADPKLAHDCYVVQTDELAPVVREFVSRWSRSRPSDSGQPIVGQKLSRRPATFVTANDWLAQETGLPRHTIQAIQRGSRRRRYTSLAEADAIVTAIGVPHLISGPATGPVSLVASGAIRVIEHPRGCHRC